MLKKIFAAVLVLTLLLCAAAQATEVVSTAKVTAASAEYVPGELPEGVRSLPIDMSPGLPYNQANFSDPMTYSDPSLSVTIETGREDGCDWWVATIKVADPSQLRTASAGGFNSNAAMSGTGIARRMNAVLAIDGDYFCYTGRGFILRQGELYLNDLPAVNDRNARDVLLVDANGDFHAFYKPEPGSIGTEIDGVPVVNAFFFGPILVDNGECVKNVSGSDMAAKEGRQRMCIAQVGPLEYKAICCAPPARGNRGMTLEQFAKFVARQGVQVAYNLDGGDSCMMIVDGEKINDVRNPSTRKICDIIYFASAYEDPEVAGK